MDKTVVSIRTPDETVKSAYALMINRGGMMGGPSNVFFVDGVSFKSDSDGKPHTIRAWLNRALSADERALGFDYELVDETVVEFTYGTPYIMVKRNLLEFMTPLEAASRQKAEEVELSALYKTDGPPSVPIEAEFPVRGYL